MTRIRIAFLATAAMAVSSCATLAEPDTADIVIRGGTIYDGSTGEAYVGDIAIRGDRIVAVGPSLDVVAGRTEDAGGMIVAPGFIDPHTHPDSYLRSADPQMRLNAPWLAQGVSTLVIGVDGAGTPDVAQELAKLEASGIGSNVAALVGFSPVRTRIIGEVDRAPTNVELAQERQLVATAMCEGAFGFSTGLFYAPQSFAQTDEVIALAREAAARGGIYDTHQRDESSYSIGLVASVEEALRIGREAGLPVHFAHLKALGVDVHGQSAEVIAHIEAARASGLQVTADQYPWLASGSNLQSALVPRWAVDGGYQPMLDRFADEATLARIIPEMEENLRRRGGPDSLLLTATGFEWSGKRLGEIAAEWGIDPIPAAIRILSSDVPFETLSRRSSLDRGQIGRTASFNMVAQDVEAIMRQHWVVTGSDGSDGHPRQYATYPMKYASYVKDKGVLTVGEFIHRSTGRVAEIYGIEDRGYLRPGTFADIVVFDPERYAPVADYLNPRQLAVGITSLYINGELALKDGQATGATPGRGLRHRPTPGSCPQ